MKILLKQKQFAILCAKKNLSPTILSKKLKISRSYISVLTNYEKYEILPSPCLREKILKLLDVDFDSLFIYKQRGVKTRYSTNRSFLSSLHSWVRKNKGKPKVCEHCGFTSDKPRKLHWANKDHSYKRILDDYIALCVFCHRKYDVKYNKNKSILFLYNKNK